MRLNQTLLNQVLTPNYPGNLCVFTTDWSEMGHVQSSSATPTPVTISFVKFILLRFYVQVQFSVIGWKRGNGWGLVVEGIYM